MQEVGIYREMYWGAGKHYPPEERSDAAAGAATQTTINKLVLAIEELVETKRAASEAKIALMEEHDKTRLTLSAEQLFDGTQEEHSNQSRLLHAKDEQIVRLEPKVDEL